jgi:hypothetical protein
VTTGRVHFDIGQSTTSTASDRAAMIHEYLAGCDGLCATLNAMCDSPTPQVFHATACCLDEGGNLTVSPRGDTNFAKRFHKMPPALASRAGLGAGAALGMPTVIVQGMSSKAGCYICVDTSIIEDDNGFYPTDALYKLYCD